MRYLPIVLAGLGLSLYTMIFLFITYPSTCTALSQLSGGAITCGIGPGVYILGFALGLCVIVYLYLLYSALMTSLEIKLH